MSLRARFTLAMLLLVLVVLTSALAGLYTSERRYLLQQIQLEVRESTRRLASVCEEALASQSDLIALNYLKAWRESPGAREVLLVNQAGSVYLHSALLDGDSSAVGRPAGDAFVARSLGSGDILYERGEADPGALVKGAAPVRLFGRRFGSVIAVYDRDRLEARVGRALEATARNMLLTTGGALALGFVLSVGLAFSLNRPIVEMVEAARRIGAGDFAFRIATARSDELGLLAREFNLMAAKLQELDALKDRFLHSVSHEMRAPLSVVASSSYHARRSVEQGRVEGVQEDLAQIERGTERLTGFVNNILDLARLQAGRISFTFERVEPARLLDETRRTFLRKAEDFQILFEVKPGESLVPVRADPARVQQVLANLVLNAFKYTPAQGRVTVGAQDGPEGVVFSVSDTGPGIPEKALPDLFTRFGLADPVPNPRKIPSSGLGLSICKEIVEAHRGRIWVESAPGRGSVFRFVLSRAPAIDPGPS